MFKNIFNFFFGCLRDFFQEIKPEKPKIRLKNDFSYEASEFVAESNLSATMKLRVLGNLYEHFKNNKYVDLEGYLRLKEKVREVEDLEQRGLVC